MSDSTTIIAAPSFIISETEHKCVWRGKDRWPSVGRAMRRAARMFNPWARDIDTPESIARKERGSRTHEVLYHVDKGSRVTYDPFYEPYVEAWLKASNELGANWIEREVPRARIQGDKLIWGIPDAMAHDLIVEVKTVEEIGSYQQSYLVQTAAYMWIVRAKNGCVAYVDSHGEYALKWVEKKDEALWGVATECVFGSDEVDE